MDDDGGQKVTGAGREDSGCQAARDRLPLHFYDQVEVSERRPLEEHLQTCPHCARAWQETRDVLGAIDAGAAFPREGMVDWPEFARATVARARAGESLGAPPRARPQSAFLWGGLLAAAAALCVAVGLGIRRQPAVPVAGPSAPGDPAVSPEAARFLQQSLARQGAARYLRDSRSLLVGLVNAPVRCRRSDGSLDIALEKERARDLLRRKNLYLDALSAPRDQRLAQLMRQLETVLLQVSSLDDCAAAQQIHDLRTEIERRQILLRIDLISREVERGPSRA